MEWVSKDQKFVWWTPCSPIKAQELSAKRQQILNIQQHPRASRVISKHMLISSIFKSNTLHRTIEYLAFQLVYTQTFKISLMRIAEQIKWTTTHRWIWELFLFHVNNEKTDHVSIYKEIFLDQISLQTLHIITNNLVHFASIQHVFCSRRVHFSIDSNSPYKTFLSKSKRKTNKNSLELFKDIAESTFTWHMPCVIYTERAMLVNWSIEDHNMKELF